MTNVCEDWRVGYMDTAETCIFCLNYERMWGIILANIRLFVIQVLTFSEIYAKLI